MCAKHEQAKPNLLASVLTNKCPRCRRGKLYTSSNPYNLKTTMRMPERCAVCGQRFELETGFYFGTGYVSYGLSVLFTALFFIGWALTLGLSYDDNSIFWCLGFNAVFLVLLQPLLQRVSRSVWIACFVRYDADWRHTKPVEALHGYEHEHAN